MKKRMKLRGGKQSEISLLFSYLMLVVVVSATSLLTQTSWRFVSCGVTKQIMTDLRGGNFTLPAGQTDRQTDVLKQQCHVFFKCFI